MLADCNDTAFMWMRPCRPSLSLVILTKANTRTDCAFVGRVARPFELLVPRLCVFARAGAMLPIATDRFV
jgi:hypothetical protein